jgi:hypothetical protein
VRQDRGEGFGGNPVALHGVEREFVGFPGLKEFGSGAYRIKFTDPQRDPAGLERPGGGPHIRAVMAGEN